MASRRTGRRAAGRCDNHDVDLGPILVVIAIVIALPSSFLIGGMVISAITGWALKENGEATHEGSELVDLNR